MGIIFIYAFVIFLFLSEIPLTQSCEDQYPAGVCGQFREQNQCSTVFNVCQFTCNRCPTVAPISVVNSISSVIQANCKDLHEQCSAFAKIGLCATNPTITRICPLSCRTCTPVTIVNKWSSWSTWGSCSVTCGKGLKTRRRSCVSGSCNGIATATKPCALPQCAIPCVDTLRFCSVMLKTTGLCDRSETIRNSCQKSCNRCVTVPVPPKKPKTPGRYGSWSEFTPCSATCGKGLRKRFRKCPPGKTCKGNSSSSKSCFIQTCPTKKPKPSWSAWGEFGGCSVTCGRGRKKRIRSCNGGNSCRGLKENVKRCFLAACPKKEKPASWGPWGRFGSCSVTCGKGRKTRTRKCSKGNQCKGNKTSTQSCNARRCPPKTTSTTTTTTTTTKATPTTGGWSRCSKTCGSGTRFRYDSPSCTSPSNPKCFKTFEECSAWPCPKASCTGYSEPRYGIPHDCCTAPAIQRRILNGVEAGIEQWPWMVFITTTSGEICGGTIIHAQWILTAGHCVTRSNGRMMPSEIRIHVGIEKLSEKGPSNEYRVDWIRDPSYSNVRNDIALLRLTKSIPLTSRSKPVSLPHKEVTPTDTTCFTTGWGLTDPNPAVWAPSEPLMQVDLQILDAAMCKKAYHTDARIGSYVLNEDKIICAGSLSKINDACNGDSGGPLVCQRCSSCEWYIAGITSFGPKGTCGKIGSPGGYTKVAAFESWIHSVIPSLKTSEKFSCTYQYGP